MVNLARDGLFSDIIVSEKVSVVGVLEAERVRRRGARARAAMPAPGEYVRIRGVISRTRRERRAAGRSGRR